MVTLAIEQSRVRGCSAYFVWSVCVCAVVGSSEIRTKPAKEALPRNQVWAMLTCLALS